MRLWLARSFYGSDPGSADIVWAHSCICGLLTNQLKAEWSRGTLVTCGAVGSLSIWLAGPGISYFPSGYRKLFRLWLGEFQALEGPTCASGLCHSPHILLDKSSQKTTPDSRSGDSTLLILFGEGVKFHSKGHGFDGGTENQNWCYFFLLNLHITL